MKHLKDMLLENLTLEGCRGCEEEEVDTKKVKDLEKRVEDAEKQAEDAEKQAKEADKEAKKAEDSIKDEKDFRSYAENKFKEVFGDKLDKDEMKKVIDGLLEDNKEDVEKGNWGELVGKLNKSFGS